MNKFTSNDKVGDIAAKFPKVVDIYKAYNIDFCCGGHRTIKAVTSEQDLDEEKVLDKINSQYQDFLESASENKNWFQEPLQELVDYIVNVHHAYLYDALPEISHLTTMILRAHGQNHPELSKVHKLFHQLKMELDSHLIDEETVQYPAIEMFLKTQNKGDLDKAITIIDSLEKEHTNAGDVLKELRKITNDYQVPSDGCGTYHKTYEKLQELEADMFQHIHLENNILFPRLKALK